MFEDHTTWITGAGSGIGRALAVEFARLGADVALSGRREDRLREVAAEVEALGRRALVVPRDVTDEGSVRNAVERTVDTFGKLDVAVANAGFGVTGTLEEVSDAEWRRQFDVNVFGLVNTIRHAAPELRKTRGRMALMGSVAGMLSSAGAAPYCASKFAVRAIGLALSQELHGSGATCTTIAPGYVESEIRLVDNEGVLDPDGEDEAPRRLTWKADRAARVIAKGIHRRKRELVVTGHGKLGGWLGRHAPGVLHWLMTRRKG